MQFPIDGQANSNQIPSYLILYWIFNNLKHFGKVSVGQPIHRLCQAPCSPSAAPMILYDIRWGELEDGQDKDDGTKKGVYATECK